MGDEETKMPDETAVDENAVDEKDQGLEAEGAYELDLDTGADAEEAMRSALDAVEKKRRRKKIEIEDSPADESAGSGATESGTESATQGGDEKAAALQERLMRTLADFDNFRKRTEREKAKLKQFAVTEVLKDVLGVVDNLERATAASGTIEELKQGLEMILRQQAEVMKRFGVQAVEATGQPFDPTQHEAVAREDSTEVDVPTVIRELQKGYTIHDRLLRPAMVHVAMPVAPRASKDQDPSYAGQAASDGGDDSGRDESGVSE